MSVCAEQTNEQQNDIGICQPDSAWPQRAAISTFVRDHYYAFDVHSRAVFNDIPLNKTLLLSNPQLSPQTFATKHERILDIISRLSYLLPHFSHPMDFPRLLERIELNQFSAEPDDSRGQFIRMTLASQMRNYNDQAATLLHTFISQLDELEQSALELKWDEASAEKIDRFNQLMGQLKLSRDDFAGLAKQVIFNQDMPKQVLSNLEQFCQAQTQAEPD